MKISFELVSVCMFFFLKVIFVFKTPRSLESLRFVYFKIDKFARNEHLDCYYLKVYPDFVKIVLCNSFRLQLS